MPAFVDQTKGVNRVALDLIVNEERKRLRPAAGKTVRANVIAATPADEFAGLPREAFVEVTRQPLRDLAIPVGFAQKIIAEPPAKDCFHRGLPKTSSKVRPESLPETKSSSR